MRLAGVFVVLILATSTAYAGDPLPFEIVRMLPETNQVLVYDRAHNTHLLLQPGSTFEDYTVIEVGGLDMVIEKDQQRFTVYPREAKYLSLNLYPRAVTTQPPIIFGKSAPAPAPTKVADTKTTDAKVKAANELAIAMTTQPPRARPTLSAPVLSSKLAP
jgi:hypothetical protein